MLTKAWRLDSISSMVAPTPSSLKLESFANAVSSDFADNSRKARNLSLRCATGISGECNGAVHRTALQAKILDRGEQVVRNVHDDRDAPDFFAALECL